MARNLGVTTPASSGITAVEVPEDVAAELKELAEHLAANPDQVGTADFDTEAELGTWVAQARYWADQNGLKFRQVRAKKGTRPPTHTKFRLTSKSAPDAADETE